MLHEHLCGRLPVIALEYHNPILDCPTGSERAFHLRAELVHVFFAHLETFYDGRGFSKTPHFHPYLYASLLPIQFGENVLESLV